MKGINTIDIAILMYNAKANIAATSKSASSTCHYLQHKNMRRNISVACIIFCARPISRYHVEFDRLFITKIEKQHFCYLDFIRNDREKRLSTLEER